MPMSPRLLRPRAASGFDPRSISGIEAWWDFSDSATITLDTGISSIADKSGQSRTATQAVGANQPLLSAAARNGRSAASFDGINDSLTTQTVSADLGAWTCFAALRLVGYGGGSLGRVWTRSDTQRALFVDGGVAGSSRFVAGQGAGAYRSPDGSAALNSWYRLAASSTGTSTATVEIFVNGVKYATTLAGTNSTSSVASTAYVIGDRSSGSRQFDGLIGELLIYSRLLTAAEIEAVDNYIGRKWAL